MISTTVRAVSRRSALTRPVAALVVASLTVLAAAGCGRGAGETPGAAQPTASAPVAPASPASGKGAPGAGSGRTLVLYDTTGEYGALGEEYAVQTVNLVSHFNAWTAHPVTTYKAGEFAAYTSVIYIGSTYDEPLPEAFLADVTSATKPVLWLNDNIWELTDRDTAFASRHGFMWKGFDTSTVKTVSYKGTGLTRDEANKAGIMDHVIYQRAKATVVASAVRADGTTFPWAIRSGHLTYVGEIPFSYVSHDDRYLAFADILFDALKPAAAIRHRALVRIEDVGPNADPANLRQIADYLYGQRVPFSVAVYPRYRDPKGAITADPSGRDYTLEDRPQVVEALKYMQAHGGTLLMHGYTHQYGEEPNPYNGVSASDFEFYRTHIDENSNVIFDGPVAEDSTSWAQDRVTSANAAFTEAGLQPPTIFEFPHYAGSPTDYKAVAGLMGARYDRGTYFPGNLSGRPIDFTNSIGQFFPYTVRDVYGSPIVPENLGNVVVEGLNNHVTRGPADILASAKRNLVVRDGVASFFYHPYLGTVQLDQIVRGLKGMGYTFVTPAAMLTR